MYKLCERGESVFPLYLVDKEIPLKRLALWNGIIRSLASVAGTPCPPVVWILNDFYFHPDPVLTIISDLN
jgi:hypothetical protein